MATQVKARGRLERMAFEAGAWAIVAGVALLCGWVAAEVVVLIEILAGAR